MTDSRAEFLKFEIKKAVAELDRSETGRSVKKQLYTFLQGRISNLDTTGWESVMTLLQCYNCGMPGSVLDALSEGEQP